MAVNKATNHELINSGISAVGKVPWGTHFCQFYKTQKDLSNTLVPYFKAGLENNEFCVWVTSDFLTKEEAFLAMEKGVPNFSNYLKKGQIEIFPYTEWYLKEGKFELKRVLKKWLEKHNKSLSLGYKGLRVSGNPFWIDNKKDWDDFAAYEAEINNVIGHYKLLVLCTYSLEKCHATEVIDVVTNHEFALIKRSGDWELIETAEQKRTKEELYQRELELQTILERQKNFFTIIGHELGNLITPIVLSLSFIKKKQVEDSIKHTIEMIDHQTRNMSGLVKDLLEISRLERGNIKLNKKRVNISSIIKNTKESVRPLIEEAKQKLEISSTLPDIMINADPLRLEQILTNLLNNASKYSKEKGRIKLNIQKKNGSVFIKIKDEGVGIPKNFLPNVFDLFVRGSQSPKRKKEGLGIGLYFSRELARLHKGDVFVESFGRGKGSEFTVKIPIKNND